MAIIFAALFNLCLVIIAANNAKGLPTLVSFVDIGALTAFIMLHISVIGYFKLKKGSKGALSWFLDVFIPIVGILVLLPVLLHIDNYAKIVGVVWLAIGLIILYFNRDKAQLNWLDKVKY